MTTWVFCPSFFTEGRSPWLQPLFLICFISFVYVITLTEYWDSTDYSVQHLHFAPSPPPVPRQISCYISHHPLKHPRPRTTSLLLRAVLYDNQQRHAGTLLLLTDFGRHHPPGPTETAIIPGSGVRHHHTANTYCPRTVMIDAVTYSTESTDLLSFSLLSLPRPFWS